MEQNKAVYPEENKLDILFNKKMVAGNYKLIFDWIEPPAGVDKKLTGEALNIVMSDDIKYRNDYYGVLAVVQKSGTSGSSAKYNIETFANEEEFQNKKNKYEEVLLVFKGDFVKDDTFDAGETGENVKYVAKSVQGDTDKIIINGCIDALTISGITESDAYISVNVDGNPVIISKTLKDINAVMGEEGDFTFDVNIGKGYYKKNVEVIVSDEIGNTEKVQCDVYNNGLGNVKELDVALSADTTGNTEKEWVSYSGKNLFLNKNTDTSVALQLSAITNDNNVIVLNDMENVSWKVDSVLGGADINNNKLTIEKDSHGFVSDGTLWEAQTAL